MSQIDIKQAGIRFENLVEQASRGQEVVITKNDRPLARLCSASGKRQRQFGSIKGAIWMSDDFDEPLEDFQEYM